MQSRRAARVVVERASRGSAGQRTGPRTAAWPPAAATRRAGEESSRTTPTPPRRRRRSAPTASRAGKANIAQPAAVMRILTLMGRGIRSRAASRHGAVVAAPRLQRLIEAAISRERKHFDAVANHLQVAPPPWDVVAPLQTAATVRRRWRDKHLAEVLSPSAWARLILENPDLLFLWRGSDWLHQLTIAAVGSHERGGGGRHSSFTPGNVVVG
jgi:hypothetical protein